MSGTTWLVPDPDRPDQYLVLKEPREADGQAELDIKQEARALNSLKLEGCLAVPQLMDIGLNPVGDIRFIVTENLSPRFAPLDRRPERVFTARDILRITKAALGALEPAHRLGFTHGDLLNKPEHVWLRVSDWGADTKEPLVKVMDWGNAQWIAERGASSPADDLASLGSLLVAHWPTGTAGPPPEAEVKARTLLAAIAARHHQDAQLLLEAVTRQLEEHDRELSALAGKLAGDVTADTFDADLAWLQRADPDRADIDGFDRARDVSEFLLEAWRRAAQGLDGLASGSSGTIADLDEAIRRAGDVSAHSDVYEGAGTPVVPFVDLDRQARRRVVADCPETTALAQASDIRGLGDAKPFLVAARALIAHEGMPQLPDRASPAGLATWREVATALGTLEPERVRDSVALLLIGAAHADLHSLAGASDLAVPDPQAETALPEAFAALARAAQVPDPFHVIDAEVQQLASRLLELGRAREEGNFDEPSLELDQVRAISSAAQDARAALEVVTAERNADDPLATIADPLATIADRLATRYRATLKALGEYEGHRNLVGNLLEIRDRLREWEGRATKLLAAWDRGDPLAVAVEARTITSLDPAATRDLVLATNRAIAAARARAGLRRAASGAIVTVDDARGVAASLRALGPAAWLAPALDALEAAVGDGASSGTADASPEVRQARDWAMTACIRALDEAPTGMGSRAPSTSPGAARETIAGAFARLRSAADRRQRGAPLPLAARGPAGSEGNLPPGAREILAITLAVEVDTLATRALSPPADRPDGLLDEVRAVYAEAHTLRPSLASSSELASRVALRARALESHLTELDALREAWESKGLGIDVAQAKKRLEVIAEAAGVDTTLVPIGDDSLAVVRRNVSQAVGEAHANVDAIDRLLKRIEPGAPAHPMLSRREAIDDLEQLADREVASLDKWLGTHVARRLKNEVADLGAGASLTRGTSRSALTIPDATVQSIQTLPSERERAGGGNGRAWLHLMWFLPAVAFAVVMVANHPTGGYGLYDKRVFGPNETTVLWPFLGSLILTAVVSVAVWRHSCNVRHGYVVGLSLLTGFIGASLLGAVLWPVGSHPRELGIKCPQKSTATETFVVTARGSVAEALDQVNKSSDCAKTAYVWQSIDGASPSVRSGQTIEVRAATSTFTAAAATPSTVTSTATTILSPTPHFNALDP